MFSALVGSDDEEDESDNDGNSNEVDDGKDGVKAASAAEYKALAASTGPVDSLANMAIAGTVAHMKCRVVAVTDAVDAGHYLVTAQVEGAHCHPDYWVNKGIPQPLESFVRCDRPLLLVRKSKNDMLSQMT
jgi:flavin reductase (DIM6/NTAB) family NADH-FMN oxidoreductase RutF